MRFLVKEGHPPHRTPHACTLPCQNVGEKVGFMKEVWKIMQLGNFSLDLVGSVSEHASRNLGGKGQLLNAYLGGTS